MESDGRRRPSTHPPGAFNVHPIGEEPDGATPLREDDLDGLIPDFVATRSDLNEVEFAGITNAMPWALARAERIGPEGVLTVGFGFDLHRQMFRDVWRWAGRARTRGGLNLGVGPDQIHDQTKRTFDDARWWHDEDTFTFDERAVRIHHRLVVIHPFRNGNGRWSRLVADLYLRSVDQPHCSWGGPVSTQDGSASRHRYIRALQAADEGDYDPLLAFARR